MSNQKRNALGKGLSALLEENSITSDITEADIMSVEPSLNQPRKAFDDEKLQELADIYGPYDIPQYPLFCRHHLPE